MARKIGMILYWTIGVVLLFLVYTISYNGGASDNFHKLLDTALDNNNYLDVSRTLSMYSVPLDSVPAYESDETQENNHVVIFNAVNQATATYKDEDGKEINYSTIQFTYYLFIYNNNFPTVDKKVGNTVTNQSGLKFYDDNLGKSYNYYFHVSSDVNSTELIENPNNFEAALYNVKRDDVSATKDYGFILIPVREELVTHIKNNSEIEKITSFEIIDTEGNVVDTKITVDLDFSQTFYNDLKDFRDASDIYDKYSKRNYSNLSNEEKEAYDNANDYINHFKEDFDNGLYNSNYVVGYAYDDIYNAKLVWYSIGMASLGLVVVILVFILIFYFKRIKNWAFRSHSGRTQRIVPNKDNRPKTEEDNKPKTNYDRVIEQRRIDMEKKKAREEEIKKSGNSIIRNNNEEEKVEDNEDSTLDNNDSDLVEENNNEVINEAKSEEIKEEQPEEIKEDVNEE